MVRILGLIMIVGGVVSLAIGAAGLLRNIDSGVNPWIFALLGLVLLLTGATQLTIYKDVDDM